jgi:hypothetical protein
VCKLGRNLTALCFPGSDIALAALLHLLPQHRQRPVTELACRWVLQDESEVHACAALFSGLHKLTVSVPAQCERAFVAMVPQMATLKEIDVRIVEGTGTDAILLVIAEHCVHLERISCTGMLENHGAAATILARNPRLRKFGWNKSLYPAGEVVLRVVACHCPLYDEINCVGTAAAAVLNLATACTHLSSIYIEDCDATDEALSELGALGRKLMVVALTNCPHITEAGLHGLITSCRSLFHLSVNRPAFDASAIERIKSQHVKRSLLITLD